MPYYVLNQMNSGGYYVIEPKYGIGCNTIFFSLKLEKKDVLDEFTDTLRSLYQKDLLEDNPLASCECCGPRWGYIDGPFEDLKSLYASKYKEEITWILNSDV